MAIARVVLEVDTATGKAKLADTTKGLKETATAAKAAKAELRGMADDMASKLGPAGNVLKAVGAGGIAAAVGIAAMGVAVKVTADEVLRLGKKSDEIKNLAASLGVSTRAFQELSFAAKTSGSSTEAMVGAAKNMQRELAAGSDVFQRLGMDVKKLREMQPEAAFAAIAERIRGIPNPTLQAAAAMEVFGRSGSEMLPAIKAGLSGLAEEAHRLGVVLDDETLDASAALSNEVDKLGIAWEGLRDQFAAAIAENPALVDGVRDIVSALGELSAWVKEHKAEVGDFFAVLGRVSLAVSSLGLSEAGFALKDLQNRVSGPDPDRFDGWGAGRRGADRQHRLSTAGRQVTDFVTKDQQRAAEAAAREHQRSIERAHEMVKKINAETIKFWTDWRAKGQAALDDLAKHQKDWIKTLGGSLDEQLERALRGAGRHALTTLGTELGPTKFWSRDPSIQKELKAAGGHLFDNTKRTLDWRAALNDVANTFTALGGTAGGILGTIAGGIASVGAGIQGWQDASKVKGIQGVLGQAAAGLGIAGTALGVGQSLFGALSGQAEHKRVNDMRDDFVKAAGGLDALNKKAHAAGLTLDKLLNAKKVKDYEAAVQQLQGTFELQEMGEKLKGLRIEKLTAGAAGLAALFKNAFTQFRAGGDDVLLLEERLNRLGLMGAAVFLDLKRQGLSTVEAFKALGPALDEALKAAEQGGVEISGLFGQLVQFRNNVLNNEGLVNTAEGLNAVFAALRSTGNLTTESAKAFQAEFRTVFDEMAAAGFTTEQILAMFAPTLVGIQKEMAAGRVVADEWLSELMRSEEAQEAMAGVKDPLDEIKAAMDQMVVAIGALVQAFGKDLPESVRKYIDEINRIPTIPGPPGVGGGETREVVGPRDGNIPGHATGFFSFGLPRDYVFRAHRGERVEITPASQTPARNAMAQGGVSLSYNPTFTFAPGSVRSDKDVKDITAAARAGDEKMVREIGEALRRQGYRI